MAGTMTSRPPRTLAARIRRHIVDAAMDIPLDPPTITALFGPSGAGKSTILRCIAGLDHLDAGKITLAGQVLDDGRTRVRPQARDVGYMFQDLALFPHLTVEQNVAYGLTSLPPHARATRVTEALRSAGVAGFERRTIRELSGGEAQRVALARTLAPRPKLLLLDEPLSALDTPTRLSLRRELRALVTEAAIPTILVTHDRDEAHSLADRVIVLVDGTVHQVGAPEQVFNRPTDAAVAQAVGMENSAEAEVVEIRGDRIGLRTGAGDLVAATAPEHSHGVPVGTIVNIFIRAGDIGIEPNRSAPMSADTNCVPATVIRVTEEASVIRIDLDAGIPLIAYLTRRSYNPYIIHPGAPVIAVVAATAIHVIKP
ncbi:MAG: Molybdate transporter, ATP-binding protein [Cryobacterium sp.]|nr:Molybdate transporter, ATP-binding protein [Cryobacterium sp.]